MFENIFGGGCNFGSSVIDMMKIIKRSFMGKQLVFIDDSGDPGFKKTSSANFVMAAAVFIDSDVASELSSRISEYRKSLHWRKNTEFKFSKDRKEVIIDLLKIVCEYDFRIYAVYLDKTRFGTLVNIIDKNKLYDWMVAELLRVIPLNDVKVRIDGRSGRQNMRKIAAYLRHELDDVTRKLEIGFEDSRNNDLIQLADLVAGSINRSLSKSKTDANAYLRVLKNKIEIIKEIVH